MFKASYISRSKHRTTKRSIEESLKLAKLAEELSSTYLEVVEWRDWMRVLAVKM